MHLIEIGIDIETSSKNSKDIIESAARYGYLDTVKYFINKDGNAESHLNSVIKIAIGENKLNIVTFIFDEFDISDVDTYFTYACQKSGVDTVNFFSKFNIGNETIKEAANIALKHNNFGVLLYLVENGASSDYLTKIKQELESDSFVKL